MGFYVFVLVLSFIWYIEEEKEVVKYFVRYFGENIYWYLIIFFIRKDDLDYEKKSLYDYIIMVLYDL